MKGIIKVKLDKLQLNPSGPVGKDSYILRLQLGSTVTTTKLKGFEADLNSDTQLFPFEEIARLEITVMEKESSEKAAFAAIPLQQLAAMPNTQHTIKVNLIYRVNKTKELEVGEAGTMLLRLKYNSNVKGGLMDVRIEKATLVRDTELIGKMDPFVEIKLGDKVVRTSVKEQAGKLPVWMEQYTLPMTNELEQLKLTVLDEDIASNDVVGSATIDLKDKNLLLSNDGMFWPVTVDLLHEGSKAGELVLAVRYHPAPTS